MRSPRLQARKDGLYLPGVGRFVCLSILDALVDVPTAESYWLEVQTEQWPDKSGQILMLDVHLWDIFYWHKRDSSRCFCIACEQWLEKLKLKTGRRRVYFRLLYS